MKNTKKFFCCILSLVLLCSFILDFTKVSAENTEELDFRVRFEGESEPVKIKILIKDSIVYVSAEEISEHLKLNFKRKNEMQFSLSSFRKEVGFVNGKDTCIFTNGMKIFEYKMPGNAMIKKGICWIPFTMLAKLMYIEYETLNRKFMIYQPKQTVFDIITEASVNRRYFYNCWDVFEVTNDDLSKLGIGASIIKTVSDLIHADLSILGSFSSFATCFSYDKKYGSELLSILIAPIGSEMDADWRMAKDLATSSVDMLLKNPEFVKDITQKQEKEISYWISVINKMKQRPSSNMPDIKDWDKIYEKLEKAQIRKENFPNKLSMGVATLSTFLDALYFYGEFSNRSELSLQSVDCFVDGLYVEDSNIPKESIFEIKKDLKQLKGNGIEYAIKKLISDKLSSIVINGVFPITGAVAFVFDATTSIVLPLKEALDTSDNYFRSLYATCYAGDAFNAMLNAKKNILRDDKIDTESIQNTKLLAYNYLKSCYVARKVGMIAFSQALSMNPEIEKEQNKINDKIIKMLNDLPVNKLGCISENKEEFLRSYDDSELINLIKPDFDGIYGLKIWKNNLNDIKKILGNPLRESFHEAGRGVRGVFYNGLAFAIGSRKDDNDKIYNIELENNLYTTDYGIKVGMRRSEIEAIYNEIYGDQKDGYGNYLVGSGFIGFDYNRQGICTKIRMSRSYY